MGDIYVHVRMKDCCRTTLGKLDKRKKKASFEGGLLGIVSLLEALGEKTIDEALEALLSGGKAGGRMEELTRAACVKVIEKHAAHHEGKGETEEGAFWWTMANAICGEQRQPAQKTAKSKADALKSAADDALKKHPNACNQSTAAVASAMGHDELSGLNANQQVDYMETNWEAVDAKTAQEKANDGELVIGGLPADGHGHTTVVVPGPGAIKPDGNFYPNVEGGSLGGAGTSDGTKTAGDIWSRSVRGEVKYYTPK